MLVFDTFAYAQNLEKVGFTEEQTEVQIDLLHTLIDCNLATKQDIANMRIDIAEPRKKTQQNIEHFRKENQLGPLQIIANLKKDIAKFKAGTLK